MQNRLYVELHGAYLILLDKDFAQDPQVQGFRCPENRKRGKSVDKNGGGALNCHAGREDFLLDKEIWKKRIRSLLTLDSHPGHISMGFAVGVFISFTPFFGLHTILAIAAAFLLRINKVTCLTGSWVNTPFTVVPVLMASYRLGEYILGHQPERIILKDLSLSYAIELLQSHGAPLLIGTSLVGFAAALVSYAFLYYIIIRFRRKDETLNYLTEEMEKIGEELE
jgi:uncharacterized protein (DUF2062 family)